MHIFVKITREENAKHFGKSVGDVVEVPLEDYVAGVVASEVGNASIEAAKAQAVAARTHAWPYYSSGKAISDSSATNQAFRAVRISEKDYPNAVYAAHGTAGEVLYYHGQVISTCVYSANNGGRTTSSQERWGGYRAWLIAQDDPWDIALGSTSKTGHGVGMSQRGAKYAASIGLDYRAILAFYYPGTNIAKEGDATTVNVKVMTVIQAAEMAMGWPYVYGAWGALCTPSERRSRANSHTDHKEAIYKNCQVLNGRSSSCSGCKWDGARCFDCRGFTYWCLSQAGIKISGAGATSQYNASANWMAQGNISDMPDVVCCLFKHVGDKMIHTGLHVGGGKIIHCSVNVQTGKTTDSGWTHYAIPIGLYTQEELAAAGKVTIKPTVKNGSRGEAVRLLQEKLTELGYLSDKIDGIFGQKTEAAVRMFQAANALTADGICGTKTWDALLAMQNESGTGTEYTQDDTEEKAPDPQVPSIPDPAWDSLMDVIRGISTNLRTMSEQLEIVVQALNQREEGRDDVV